MSYYAVVDTNVLISALFNLESTSGQIVKLASKGVIVPLLTFDIVSEYTDVPFRTTKKYHFLKDEIEGVLDMLMSRAIYIVPSHLDVTLLDENDRPFYEAIIAARKEFVDARLITGNKKHFFPEEGKIKKFKKDKIAVNPPEMLSIIADDGDD